MWPLKPSRSLIEEMIENSAGSQLISYKFESKELRFQLFHAKAGLAEFLVPTDTVHGRTVTADPRRSLCRLDVINLAQNLSSHGGRYLPPTDPETFLKHARNRTSLAYGRRASEYGWLLVIKGQYPLLACLVRDLADIQWTSD